MGAGCSIGASKNKTEGSVKRKIKSVGSFVKRKKNSSSPDHHAESPPKNDLAHQRWSFSGGSLPSTPRKSADGSKRNSLLRKAGFERAVEVLDVLGSGVANLNSGGFMSSFNAKGRKISVLAFEVANTITKGATLMYSLSEENVRDMKQKMLSSEGILNLVSSDVNVLLNIIAEDKRHERDVFGGNLQPNLRTRSNTFSFIVLHLCYSLTLDSDANR